MEEYYETERPTSQGMCIVSVRREVVVHENLGTRAFLCSPVVSVLRSVHLIFVQVHFGKRGQTELALGVER